MSIDGFSARAWIDRPFFRNLLKVGAGGALAQAITLAFTPLITRLYGPEPIGMLGVFLSFVAIAATIATLGYPIAIVLPSAAGDARRLARMAMASAFVFAGILCLILLIGGDRILDAVGMGELHAAWLLLPLGVFLAGGVMVMEQLLVRAEVFGLSARLAVLSSLLLNAAKAAFGTLLPTALVLIATTLVVQAILLAVGAIGYRSGTRPPPPGEQTTEGYRLLVAQYRDFPLLRAPQLFINAVSQGLPILLIASFFGASTAGQYGMAWSLLLAPVALVGKAVSSVFYPRITAALRRGDGTARSLLSAATLGMALSGAVPYGIVLVAGPWLMPFVLGADWHAAGIYAQLLAPFMFLQYVNRPVVAALPGLRLQGVLLVYEVLSTSSKLLALWIGFSIFESAIWAVGLFSLFGVIAYLWLILWTLRRCSAAGEGG